MSDLFQNGRPEDMDETKESIKQVGIVNPIKTSKKDGAPREQRYKRVAQHLALDRMWYAGFACGMVFDGTVNEFRETDAYRNGMYHLFIQQDHYECDTGFFADHFERGFGRAHEFRADADTAGGERE